MASFIQKAWKLSTTRPIHIWSTARQILLFWLTVCFRGLFLTPKAGIFLAENVRVQRLRCFFAERPSAEIRVGRDSIIYENAQIQAFGSGKISIGEGSIIGDAKIYARASIQVGSHVVTSWNVFIQDFDPHPTDPENRIIQMKKMVAGFTPSSRKIEVPEELHWEFPSTPIQIGDNVWIGANVTILRGAKIGSDSVIATGAVVTGGEYPPRSILAGVPAKVIKSL